MKTPQIIDFAFLHALSQEAYVSPRKRKNFNFHAAETDASHRLLNALALHTYIVPHRPLDLDKDESIFVVRGKLGALFFDERGEVSATAVLSPLGPALGVNVPAGTFHTLVALEPDTVFFEAKAGPYRPLTMQERAPWAPAENTDEATSYLTRLTSYFD